LNYKLTNITAFINIQTQVGGLYLIARSTTAAVRSGGVSADPRIWVRIAAMCLSTLIDISTFHAISSVSRFTLTAVNTQREVEGKDDTE